MEESWVSGDQQEMIKTYMHGDQKHINLLLSELPQIQLHTSYR